MFTSIIEDIKREFQHGNMVTRIIIANVVVFVLVNLVYVFFGFASGGVESSIYRKVVNFFSMSSDWWFILTHPWVIISNMFLHESFMHILFNMLFLYWFGIIVGDLIGNHRVLPIYLMGGLVGALFFFLWANFLPNSPAKASALGASAAVMALVAAAGALNPERELNLLLIGRVKLKYIVAFLVLVDLVATAGPNNVGGAFAHLGGSAFGFLYIIQLRNGTDWTTPVNKSLDRIAQFWDNLVKKVQGKPRKPRVVYRNVEAIKKKKKNPRQNTDYSDHDHQEQLDAILDKIKDKGYESLSAEEKDFLSKASKQ